MVQVTEQGRQAVQEIARRNQVSEDAVLALLHALQRGHGTAAQFDHAELGGMGQWSQGGMTQIGDMFNSDLKRKVEAMATDLSRLLRERQLFAESSEPQNFSPDGSEASWWPAELGQPSATGGQNDSAYALFPGTRRLAVRHDGRVRIFDSGGHDISGFSQQQTGAGGRLRFASQHGDISTDDLQEIE